MYKFFIELIWEIASSPLIRMVSVWDKAPVIQSMSQSWNCHYCPWLQKKTIKLIISSCLIFLTWLFPNIEVNELCTDVSLSGISITTDTHSDGEYGEWNGNSGVCASFIHPFIHVFYSYPVNYINSGYRKDNP